MRLIIFIPFHPAVDMEVHGIEISIALLPPTDLHLVGVVSVIKQVHSLTDEFNRGLKQVPFQSNGSVLSDLSSGNGAKMILEIIRRRPETRRVGGESLQWLFTRAGVDSLVIVRSDPLLQGLVDPFQGH